MTTTTNSTTNTATKDATASTKRMLFLAVGSTLAIILVSINLNAVVRMDDTVLTMNHDHHHHYFHSMKDKQKNMKMNRLGFSSSRQTTSPDQSSGGDGSSIDNEMLDYMTSRIRLMQKPTLESAYASSFEAAAGTAALYRRPGNHSHSPTTVTIHEVSGSSSPSSSSSSVVPQHCHCDLLSLDCLDSIQCLPPTLEHRHAVVLVGLELRKTIKEMARYRGFTDEEDNPIGKQLQYSTIATWSMWRKGYNPRYEEEDGNGEWYKGSAAGAKRAARTSLVLPKRYDREWSSEFVAYKRYPICSEKKLKGKSCFFSGLYEKEDVVGATVERKALRWAKKNKYLSNNNGATSPGSSNVYTSLHTGLHDLVSVVEKSAVPQNSRQTLSPFGELLTFAQIMRLLFNRRPFLDEIFQSHLTTIQTKNKNLHEWEEGTNYSDAQDEPFAIAVHMRRGDSCTNKNPRRYKKTASQIHSPPQTSAARKCYKTSVYMSGVQCIRSLIPSNRPLHVYLSTDDVGSVMEEIQTDHEEIFVVVDQWKFLNYSRSHFQYTTEFIEDEENENRPILGETAISDLWMLSHGDAFVGHLGSRFGKTGWLLATARHNNLVPYLSVDGHSFCCEIDEHCGKMSQYITDMENCMTFGHDYLLYELGESYWQHGSLARKWNYEKKMKQAAKIRTTDQ